MNTVTRIEIADCVESAFTGPPIGPADLIEYAADHGARNPVINVLGRLHEDSYRELRDLWSELNDVPVEA